MHTLPKRALAVACAAALLGTGTSALAAESVPASAPSTGISVQLDGRNLSFPDAAPEARDGRTFLPVRTVFEAMGAEVSYSPPLRPLPPFGTAPPSPWPWAAQQPPWSAAASPPTSPWTRPLRPRQPHLCARTLRRSGLWLRRGLGRRRPHRDPH